MDSIIKDKQFSKFSLLEWGVILFNLGELFSMFFDYGIWLFKLFIILGILIAIFSLFRLLTFDYSNRKRYVWIAYSLLLLWYGVMYVRSNLVDITNIHNYTHAYNILPYCITLLLLIPVKNLLRSFINLGYKINLLFIFIFFIPLIDYNNGFRQIYLETFAAGAGFIYMTNKYHSSRDCFIALITLLLAFLVATLTARRNLMLTFGMYMLIGSIGVIINGKIKSIESKLIAILVAFTLLIGAVAFYLQESSGTFSKITGRANENTRDGVLIAYAIDMGNPKDLVLGRGMFGQYYCPGVDEIAPGVFNEYREFIECGYLQWILKGGAVYLLLYLFLFGIAIYKGLRSSNQLSKGCAYILIIQLIDMAPFGLHAFNIKTYMIWLAVSVCLDENIRKMKDENITNMLFKKKLIALPWQKK